MGYLSSPRKLSLMTILRWNLRDLVARLRHQFESNLEAHCGFARNELHDLLSQNFTQIRFVSVQYTMYVAQSRYRPLVKLMKIFRMLDVLSPSHAVFCMYPRRR